MRLSTIKLAGFKSFVDPTTLHLPTNMTAVVGPNSASRLRGDSLTDVIFAGSTARKPVSQAMVELIFDNSDHTISGEFAAFNEISVKRTVSHDGQSTYALNGTRCRRRDITDLFLGTGLGPRSYSIIEQGMISQIIEAKPEDLRVYLEEAAGISKYKERRRETENRIRHTRENLERLTDVREEVGKQLQHLARQARQAEQYTTLQSERKIREAEWKSLQWRTLDIRLTALREHLAQQETKLEQVISEQREAEREIETTRERRDEAAQALSRAQAESYEVSGALARIEQQIAHQRELSQRLNTARDDALAQLNELGAHIAGDQDRLDILTAEIAADEPALEVLRERDEISQETLREAETAVADWQQRWEAHTREQAEATRAGDVERTRIDYLDRQALDASRRREQLANERVHLDVERLAQSLDAVQAQHEERQQALEALTDTVETRKQAALDLQDSQQRLQNELADVRRQSQQMRGRLASLETLQHAALGQEPGAALDWLRRNGLDSAARVGERLQVEAGWETAVETALGPLLEGVLSTNPHALVEVLADFGEGHLALVDSAETGHIDVAPTSLATKVQGPQAIRRWLAHWHAAEDLSAARAMQPALAADEAIITRSGERLGHGWIQIARSQESGQGALLREREIQTLRAQIEDLQEREHTLEASLAQSREQRLAAEQQREDAQRALYQAHREASELAGQVHSQYGRLETARTRISAIETELEQLAQTIDTRSDEAKGARARLQDFVDNMGALETSRSALESERSRLMDAREHARRHARETREQAHTLALKLESRRAQIASLTQSLARMSGQRGQIDQRLGEITQQIETGDDPVQALDAQRQAALDQRIIAERTLSEARAALDAIDQQIRTHDQIRQNRDAQALQQREVIAQQRLDQQALVIAAEQLAAAVTELGFALDEIIAGLPDEANEAAWEKTVSEYDAKLRRLEPVNLAAIAEHAETAQRKEYLDAQDADLTAALSTLEEAIAKIDRETRSRFKDTFDKVNSGMQALYPRLFGGGHGYLELTGDDLLNTGVAIMARPPGKRVSNITLLSGGEKAMTAVSLVFAIFQLNPAPFCLLDEVDAPLDEANVGRFNAMVKEMSETVQFLLVSHNKATMEAADQLCGVTMREAGVSRLVSVDLAEAARLAEAA